MQTMTLETKDGNHAETVKKYIESELVLLDEPKLEQFYQYIKKTLQTTNKTKT